MIRSQKKLFVAVLILLFLIILIFKSRSGIVLFGDFNFALFKDNKFLENFYVWNSNNFGSYDPMYVSSYPLFIFKLFSHFFSVNVISTLYFYGLYFGIFISSLYLLSKISKKAQVIDYLIVGIFSISNPLIFSLHGQTDMAYSLIGVNFFLGYAFQCYFRRVFGPKEIFSFSVISLFISIYLQTFILLIGIILLFGLAYAISRKGKINWKKTILSLIIFIGVNSFWLLQVVYIAFAKLGVNSAIGYDPNSDGLTIVNIVSETIKSFSVLMVSPFYTSDPANLLFYYMHWFSILALFSIIIFILYSTLIGYRENDLLKWRKIIQGCFFVIVLFYIFSLGTNSYFRVIFLFFWNHFPLFNLYRSILKFLFPIYFSLLILLIISLSICKSRRIKIFILLLVCVLLPVFFQKRFLQIIKNYPIPEYYNTIYNNYNPLLTSSIKLLPDTNWYTKFTWNPNHTDSVNILPSYLKQNSFYNSPSYSSKAFNYYINNYISDYVLSCKIPDKREVSNLLGLFNIKNVLFQQDNIFKDYKRYCPERINQQDYLTKSQTYGAISIYSTDSKSFLQKIYSPAKIIISDKNVTKLIDLVSEQGYLPRSAIVFEQNNQADVIKDIKEIASRNNPSLPTIEYKKINPTKYRAIIHNAKESFPLILAESFHGGWKAYVTKLSVARKNDLTIQSTGYEIIEGNDEDQVNKRGLTDFINQGLISSLAEKGQIDFVSKNFQGTIQNDNLDNGSIAETWFKSPIAEKNHLEVNGYANSWIVDPSKVCNGSNKCTKNVDGSYDMELVIEFWPQRLFYLGLFLSVSTIVLGTVSITFFWRKNKRRKNAT